MILMLFFVLIFCDGSFSWINDNVILSKNCNGSFDTILLEYDLNLMLTSLENRTTRLLDAPIIEPKKEIFINHNFEPHIIQLWKQFPFNFFINTSTLSESCQRGVNKFLSGLHQNNYWALKMFDATAKLPSGLLSGNANQFGDFEGCLSINDSQYCLADLNLDAIWNDLYSPYKNLVHSYYPFKGHFDDPQHRVPDFTSIRWGICIPSECSAKELEESLQTNFGINARVRDNMCRQSNKSSLPLSFGDYFARFFFTALLLAVVFSSLMQSGVLPKNRESKLTRIVLSFAIQNSWKRLTCISKVDNNNNENGQISKTNELKENEIKGVDGIRSICALALLMCHKSVALMYNPYINRTATMEVFGQHWTVIGRVAIVYTDSFMLLSGLLTTNSLMKDMRVYRSLKFSEKLVNRIFRLLPNIITLILFCTYLLPKLNWGPLWPLVVEHHADLCKQHMWKNIFFIHNYFGFENMCLTHTHQVGIDMQLFIFSYILSLFWFSNKFGFFITGIIWIASTILRYVVTIKYNLSHMIYFGIPIHQMFDTANLSYILPTHRATIYVTGILMAYILKHKINLNKVQIAVWWFVCILFGCMSVFGPFQIIHKGYEYSNKDAALFGALSPILWGICLSWAIYSMNHGYAGWFGDLFSWKGFKYFSKISYSFYLVQFPVFFYNVGVQKTPSEFSPHELLHFTETAVIILLSMALTLCVEIPFQSIERILFQSKTSAKKKIN